MFRMKLEDRLRQMMQYAIPIEISESFQSAGIGVGEIVGIFPLCSGVEYVKSGSKKEYITDFADPIYQLLRRVTARNEPGRKLPSESDEGWDRYAIMVERHAIADFSNRVQYEFMLPAREYLPPEQVHMPRFGR